MSKTADGIKIGGAVSADFMHKVGFTLDRAQIQHRATLYTYIHTTGNLE